MKNLLLIAIILFTFSACQYDKPIPSQLKETTPKEAGFSASRLALADSLINEYMQKDWLPGGVFLVARHSEIVYYKNFGYRSTAKDAPYQKEDIFRIASMTKAITTVAIMQLYEKGRLRLDDPVYQYIPAFKNQVVLDTFNPEDSTFTTVPAERPISIRHLLTHTSGITYGDFNSGKLQAVYSKFNMLGVGLSHQSWTTEEFINRLAEVPLAFQPGERYNYGLNMDVLGRVIEVVSGQSLAEYFKANIFDPLGMTDTYFYLPEDKQDRLAPVYAQNENGHSMASEAGLVETINYPKNKDIGHYAGGGGLSSTAMDYARFIQALVNEGNYNSYQLLGRKTIEVMTADQLISLNQKGNGISNIPGNTFCLGFGLLTDDAAGLNAKSPGTYEWGGYFSTKFFIDPKEELIFVGMTQILPFQHGEFYDKLTAIIYGAIED
ncbi:MAG: serine hydrolase domain-containing protein [Mangrovibacterium sp.]